LASTLEMPQSKVWGLRNKPPMWQPPPEDELRKSLKGFSQDNLQIA